MSCPFKKKVRIITGVKPVVDMDIVRMNDEDGDNMCPYTGESTNVYGKSYYQCSLTHHIDVVNLDTLGKKQHECLGEDKCPFFTKNGKVKGFDKEEEE